MFSYERHQRRWGVQDVRDAILEYDPNGGHHAPSVLSRLRSHGQVDDSEKLELIQGPHHKHTVSCVPLVHCFLTLLSHLYVASLRCCRCSPPRGWVWRHSRRHKRRWSEASDPRHRQESLQRPREEEGEVGSPGLQARSRRSHPQSGKRPPTPVPSCLLFPGLLLSTPSMPCVL